MDFKKLIDRARFKSGEYGGKYNKVWPESVIERYLSFTTLKHYISSLK